MNAIEESNRVLKVQKRCASAIQDQINLLLQDVISTRDQLLATHDIVRKRQRKCDTNHTNSNEETKMEENNQNIDTEDIDTRNSIPSASLNTTSTSNDLEIQTDEEIINQILNEFTTRVKTLKTETKIANELKTLHVAMSKYGKFIDKNFCAEISQICQPNQTINNKLTGQLVVEYLYQQGHTEAADMMCKEAELDIGPNVRETFLEIQNILEAFERHDIVPAQTWAINHIEELRKLHLDIEYELLKLQYIDLVESSTNAVEAFDFASKKLTKYKATYPEEIQQLICCLIFKNDLDTCPYRHLFVSDRWITMSQRIFQAYCCLNNIPTKAYLETCVSAGIIALPAIKKLMNVMENQNKTSSTWETLEEFPVEIAMSDEYRFHNVFSCPVSQEESTPENPPVLLKCGHVICLSCVKNISFGITRKFKCPTCPMEQLESETRKLYF